MEIITNLITMVKAHWVDVLAVIGAVDIILGIVTKLTPFTWDDNVYSMLHGWIAKLVKK